MLLRFLRRLGDMPGVVIHDVLERIRVVSVVLPGVNLSGSIFHRGLHVVNVDAGSILD